MTIERRAFSGTLVGIVAFLVNALQTFALVPLLLSAWGKERYGCWLAFQALTTLMITLDSGHQAYVGNELARLYFSDRSALRVVLSSGIWTAIGIGALELLLVVALRESGQLPTLLGLSPSLVTGEHLDAALFVWMFMWVFCGSIGGVVVRLLPPAGQFVRSTIWALVLSVVRTTAVACAALLGFSILDATVISAVFTLLCCGLLFRDIRKQFKDLWPMHRRPNARVGATNFAHSMLLTGTNTLAQLQQSGLNLLVTGELGVATLPAFATARTVASTFLQAANVLCAPLAPEMVRFHVNREMAKLHAIFQMNWLLSGTLIQVGTLASLPFLAHLYSIWTRHSLPFQYGLFCLLALAVALRAFGSPLQTYLASINNLRALGTINVAQTLVVLLGTFFGIHRLGLAAAGVGVLIGEAVGSCALPITFVAIVLPTSSRWPFIKNAALAMAPAFVTAVALFRYCRFRAGPLTIGLAIVGVLLIAAVQWRHLPPDLHERLRRLFRSTSSDLAERE